MWTPHATLLTWCADKIPAAAALHTRSQTTGTQEGDNFPSHLLLNKQHLITNDTTDFDVNLFSQQMNMMEKMKCSFYLNTHIMTNDFSSSTRYPVVTTRQNREGKYRHYNTSHVTRSEHTRTQKQKHCTYLILR
jgi:hypothetical protein